MWHSARSRARSRTMKRKRQRAPTARRARAAAAIHRHRPPRLKKTCLSLPFPSLTQHSPIHRRRNETESPLARATIDDKQQHHQKNEKEDSLSLFFPPDASPLVSRRAASPPAAAAPPPRYLRALVPFAQRPASGGDRQASFSRSGKKSEAAEKRELLSLSAPGFFSVPARALSRSPAGRPRPSPSDRPGFDCRRGERERTNQRMLT